MALEYTEQKITEALRLNRGNAAKARAQVILWAQTDPQLLKALTAQHLNGIVAYHVDRVASGRSQKARIDSYKPKTETPSHTMNQGERAFGMDVLRAIVQEDAKIFGLETYSAPPRRGQASQRHKDAIQKIIQSSQGKGSDR